MTPIRLATIFALFAGAMSFIQPAVAAESYDSCKNFIDSVPATISTQGVWCLRKDLATANTSGAAITINANNVTIDCNDFKIGGLAAGNASTAFGIHADDRQNVTVRNCNIRGFLYGIRIQYGAGHLIEDNRLDNNLYMGIYTSADNVRVRRNAVYDTGGSSMYAFGIQASGSVVDNVVSGLFAQSAGGRLEGIRLSGNGAVARGNGVSGFDMAALNGGNVGAAYGIILEDRGQRAADNHMVGGDAAAIAGTGISALYSNSSGCLNNTVFDFQTNIQSGCISSGNLTSP